MKKMLTFGVFASLPLCCMMPVYHRCLEVHMATLRVFYDKWVVAAAAAAGDGDDDGDQTDDEKA